TYTARWPLMGPSPTPPPGTRCGAGVGVTLPPQAAPASESESESEPRRNRRNERRSGRLDIDIGFGGWTREPEKNETARARLLWADVRRWEPLRCRGPGLVSPYASSLGGVDGGARRRLRRRRKYHQHRRGGPGQRAGRGDGRAGFDRRRRGDGVRR